MPVSQLDGIPLSAEYIIKGIKIKRIIQAARSTISITNKLGTTCFSDVLEPHHCSANQGCVPHYFGPGGLDKNLQPVNIQIYRGSNFVDPWYTNLSCSLAQKKAVEQWAYPQNMQHKNMGEWSKDAPVNFEFAPETRT